MKMANFFKKSFFYKCFKKISFLNISGTAPDISRFQKDLSSWWSML